MVRWYRVCERLLGPRTAVRRDWSLRQHSKRGNRVYVPVSRLGLVVLAALCSAVWEADDLYNFTSGHVG
jgi:hypothetical protein